MTLRGRVGLPPRSRRKQSATPPASNSLSDQHAAPTVTSEVFGVLVDIEPRVWARVELLIKQVGEAEFRRGVAQMTGWDTEIRSLDDVMCIYVMARRGRVRPSAMGQRVAAVLDTLPGRTDDDAGFSDEFGRPITSEQYVAWRTARREALSES
jgi:hypothetical protein